MAQRISSQCCAAHHSILARPVRLYRSLYPLLREVKLGIDPYKVFEDADWALLIGAKPRGPGMERK